MKCLENLDQQLKALREDPTLMLEYYAKDDVFVRIYYAAATASPGYVVTSNVDGKFIRNCNPNPDISGMNMLLSYMLPPYLLDVHRDADCRLVKLDSPV